MYKDIAVTLNEAEWSEIQMAISDRMVDADRNGPVENLCQSIQDKIDKVMEANEARWIWGHERYGL